MVWQPWAALAMSQELVCAMLIQSGMWALPCCRLCDAPDLMLDGLIETGSVLCRKQPGMFDSGRCLLQGLGFGFRAVFRPCPDTK